jgi:hypothetical protein
MTEPILQFFSFAHLPANLKEISEPFCNMARDLVDHLPRNAERSAALRHLLEAKDAAVRARLFKDAMPEEPAPATLDLRRINENQLAQDRRIQKLEEALVDLQRELRSLESRTHG